MTTKPHQDPASLPDGGWGWVVVFGCAIHTFVGGGLQRNFSLIYENMRDRFGSNAADTAWVYAINACVSLVFAPLTTALVTRVGCQVVVMTGGVLVTAGVLGMAFSPSLIAVYLSFGLISGIGNGLIQCPKFIALSLWFENRRGRATSLAMMMDGCGALAMAPLLQASFHFYGYTGALVILAGLTLQYTVSGAILRSPFAFEMRKFKNRSASCRQHGYTPENDDVDPGENSVTKCNLGVGSIDDLYFVPPVYSRRLSRSLHILPSPDIKILTPTSNRCKALWKSQRDIPDDQNSMIKANSEVILKSSANQSMGYDLEYFDASENQNERTDSGCQCENYFNYKLLRDSRYLAFNMLAVCITLCGSMTNTHLAGLCKEHGMNGVEIVTLLAIMGGVNTTFKFLSGFLFDWPPVKQYRKHIFCVMSFSFGLMQVLSPYMQSLAAFYGVWIMYMTTGAFMATQESVILADLVDRQAFASGIGLNRFFRSFGVLIGPTFGGFLKDVTGMYNYTFVFGGSILALASLFLEIVICWGDRAILWRTQCEKQTAGR